jgi:hypothetical protein
VQRGLTSASFSGRLCQASVRRAYQNFFESRNPQTQSLHPCAHINPPGISHVFGISRVISPAPLPDSRTRFPADRNLSADWRVRLFVPPEFAW